MSTGQLLGTPDPLYQIHRHTGMINLIDEILSLNIIRDEKLEDDYE